MSEESMAGLLAAMQDDADLRTRLSNAGDRDEFVRLAGEAGFAISADEWFDASSRELSDAELESAVGGYTFPQTDWIYCDNPWTNAYCTLKC